MMDDLLAKPALAALLAVSLWGINVVVMKIGVTDMAPLLFTGLRFVLLSVLLLPFAIIPRAAIRQVFGLALIMGVGHFCVLSIALRYLDSVLAGLLLLLGAPLSSLLAYLFLNERLRVLQMVALTFAGLGAMVPTLLQGAVDIQVGALIMLLCVLMWAIGNLQIRKLTSLPVLTLQFWIGFISAPLCLLAYALDPTDISLATQLTRNSVLSLIYVVGCSSLLAYGLWYQLIKRHGINAVVNYGLLQPVFTMIFGYVLLGEIMSGLQLAGGLVTIAAMWAFYHAGKATPG